MDSGGHCVLSFDSLPQGDRTFFFLKDTERVGTT